MNAADYIIVGGGSAGCVLAARLTEDPATRVLLLEAGDSEAGRLAMRMPLAWRDTFLDPAVSWGLMTEPEPHADGRRVPAPRGKVLGGCSSVNGMMYSRGCPQDYDDWARAGLAGWAYRDVLAYFRRSEANWRGAGEFHGGDGPLTVARHAPDAVHYPRLIAAARALGYAELDDFHGAAWEGFGTPDFNVHRGERASTVARFLRPAMARPNLTVLTGARVTRILLERGRATGVSYVKDGAAHEVSAAAEVVLSAGTFLNPQLLLLSGIGAPESIEAHGLKVAHELPGVGRNLQDHQSVAMIYRANGRIGFDGQLRVDRLALSVLRWLATRSGPLAGLPVSAQGFLRTDPGLDRPDLQLLMSPVSMLAKPWFPGWRRGAGHVISCAAVLLHPHSRGEVGLSSADPLAKPRIRLNLLSAQADRDGLRRIVRFVRRYLGTAPATELVDGELTPGPAVESDAEVDAFLRRAVSTAMHPTSTCAMGTGPDAVVDASLRVRGISGLRVADASVMPTIVGGNTNAPAIMIAEKAVDLIRGRNTAEGDHR